MKRLLVLLVALLALADAACRSRQAGVADAGELRLTLQVAPGAAPAGAPSAWIHVHGATAQGDAVDTWLRAAPDAGGYTVTVPRLAAGRYAVAGRLFAAEPADPGVDEADFLSTADVPVVLLARTAQTIVLLLQQNPARLPPARSDNHAPTVHGLVASAAEVDSSDPAAALALTATASDADAGDALTFAWSAVDAARPAVPLGAFSTPAASSTGWTPPPLHDGTVVLTVTATDPRGARASLSVRVRVTPRGGFGSVLTLAGVNHAPDVARLEVAHAQLAPLEATTLTAVASDADGDKLAYAWTDAGCGGRFDAPGDSSTATWTAPAAPATCTLSVIVSDLDRATFAARGAATTSTVVVHVVSTAGRAAPEFVLATRAPAGPISAGPVWFRVAAVEVAADPAVAVPVTTITWADGTGRAGAFAPQVAGAWDAVAWTPPPCPAGAAPGAAVPLTVTATATGAAADPLAPPLASAFAFPVELLCP